jgi:hypothetical protein
VIVLEAATVSWQPVWSEFQPILVPDPYRAPGRCGYLVRDLQGSFLIFHIKHDDTSSFERIEICNLDDDLPGFGWVKASPHSATELTITKAED